MRRGRSSILGVYGEVDEGWVCEGAMRDVFRFGVFVIFACLDV